MNLQDLHDKLKAMIESGECDSWLGTAYAIKAILSRSATLCEAYRKLIESASHCRGRRDTCVHYLDAARALKRAHLAGRQQGAILALAVSEAWADLEEDQQQALARAEGWDLVRVRGRYTFVLRPGSLHFDN